MYLAFIRLLCLGMLHWEESGKLGVKEVSPLHWGSTGSQKPSFQCKRLESKGAITLCCPIFSSIISATVLRMTSETYDQG